MINYNDIVVSNLNIYLHEANILKLLLLFYNNEENIEILKLILLIKTQISIRLIDYFITKYSKNNKIIYNINEELFNVYCSYKQQLKQFQKHYFDPFSRGKRIPFFLDNTYIITTIGQLNFFKWFIEKKIYDYIIKNYNDIEIDMNLNNKINKINKKNTTKNLYNIKKINKINVIDNQFRYDIKQSNIIVSFSF